MLRVLSLICIHLLISLTADLYDWLGFKKSAEICVICGLL